MEARRIPPERDATTDELAAVTRLAREGLRPAAFSLTLLNWVKVASCEG